VGSRTFHLAARALGKLSHRLPKRVFNFKTQLALDGTAAACALLLALAIRFEFQTSRINAFLLWVPAVAVLRPGILWIMHGYRSTWRHFQLSDGLNLAVNSAAPTAAFLAFRLMHGSTPLRPLPISVIVSELTLFVAFAGSNRILRRVTWSALDWEKEARQRALLISDKISISGAVRLIEPYCDIQLVGIISNDSSVHGRTIAGVPVLGDVSCLQQSIVSSRAEIVLMTSSGVENAEEVVAKTAEFGIQVHIIPTARDVVGRRVRVSHALQVEQVVDRFQTLNPRPRAAVVSCLRQRSLLVTGAGGSIGSEISRQVARLPVSRIILLDQDENSIFELMNELRTTSADVVPFVGDIRDAGMLHELFSLHKPDVVLHAAAYKHVPVMESNPCEAVLNNITGTRQLLDVAEKHNCERFVMISTDKAVHPCSVMGATKRAAELLVQHRALFPTYAVRTQFACVRFGNVVGSRGSVVPIFLRQIAAGGPVTLTHEEMTRYFMTIPQAVQLVLQAATLASSGDIYMLDMGDPVKIIELARELIRMSGLRPDIDIPIRVTGIRPGEKLQEQLWYEDSQVSETSFPSVYRVHARPAQQDLPSRIAKLEKAASSRVSNEEIFALLVSLPIDYKREVSSNQAAAAPCPVPIDYKGNEPSREDSVPFTGLDPMPVAASGDD
jgi:FlaA1/EpsC-like NDP-sugar epimerase